MRYFLYFCISTFVLISVTARLAGLVGVSPAAMATQAAPAGTKSSPPAPSKKGSGVAYVRLDRYNQFTSDIEIEGKTFKGVIDTGASTVVLRYEDANALGLFRKGTNWNRMVSTANGNGRAMAVRLNSLGIGDLIIYDVEALVLAPGAVSTNLIGMSLLRRLSKFEVRPGVIILER